MCVFRDLEAMQVFFLDVLEYMCNVPGLELMQVAHLFVFIM